MRRVLHPTTLSSSHELATSIVVFSVWKRLLWAPGGVHHRFKITPPPVMMEKPAPVVPSILELSVNNWRSVCPLSAIDFCEVRRALCLVLYIRQNTFGSFSIEFAFTINTSRNEYQNDICPSANASLQKPPTYQFITTWFTRQ